MFNWTIQRQTINSKFLNYMKHEDFLAFNTWLPNFLDTSDKYKDAEAMYRKLKGEIDKNTETLRKNSHPDLRTPKNLQKLTKIQTNALKLTRLDVAMQRVEALAKFKNLMGLAILVCATIGTFRFTSKSEV